MNLYGFVYNSPNWWFDVLGGEPAEPTVLEHITLKRRGPSQESYFEKNFRIFLKEQRRFLRPR